MKTMNLAPAALTCAQPYGHSDNGVCSNETFGVNDPSPDHSSGSVGDHLRPSEETGATYYCDSIH